MFIVTFLQVKVMCTQPDVNPVHVGVSSAGVAIFDEAMVRVCAQLLLFFCW